MAAAPGGAAPACACTNISIMQLFHELKQQFPAVPDHVVSSTISSHCHDRSACRSRLESEAKNFQSHPYPRRAERRADSPRECPNRGRFPPEPPDGESDADADAGFETDESDAAKAPKRPDSLKLEPRPPPVDFGVRRTVARAPHSAPSPPAPTVEARPFDVSVNLSCRMDVSPQPSDASAASYASVNLTVRTPTSAPNAPDDSRTSGFEGSVQITVSSTPTSSRRQLARRPPSDLRIPDAAVSESPVIKQQVRLECLERALKEERAQLSSMKREVHFLLSAPSPPQYAAHLRGTVQVLHERCQRLTERLDDTPPRSVVEGDGDVARSSRQASMGHLRRDENDGGLWRCPMCTYNNKALLNKCELCDMPRIILGMTNNLPVAQINTAFNS